MNWRDCPLMPKLHEEPGKCAWCRAPLTGRQRRWCGRRDPYGGSLCCREYLDARGRNHEWPIAREAALKRDDWRCVKCGADGKPPADLLEAARQKQPGEGPRAKEERLDALYRRYQLEVNHIIPRNGEGYGPGCHNHLDNLETLCHNDHARVTKQQAADRKAVRALSLEERVKLNSAKHGKAKNV